MATKYYAWTVIRTGGEKIDPGTVIDPKKLGDDFDSLVEARAIRTTPYPKMPSGYSGSVNSFRQDQLRALRDNVDGSLLDLDLEEEEEGESE